MIIYKKKRFFINMLKILKMNIFSLMILKPQFMSTILVKTSHVISKITKKKIKKKKRTWMEQNKKKYHKKKGEIMMTCRQDKLLQKKKKT